MWGSGIYGGSGSGSGGGGSAYERSALNASSLSGAVPLGGLSDLIITLNQADTALSFSVPASKPTWCQVHIVQDGTGGRGLTLPNVARWGGGHAPVINTAANARTTFLVGSENSSTIEGFHGQALRRESWSTPMGVDLVLNALSTPFVVDRQSRLVSVQLAAGTAPTGADVIVDINLGGVTMFTTQANRPRIVAGSTLGSAVSSMDITAIPAGSVLQAQIDQLGSTVKGQGLGVFLRLLEV